MAATLPTTCRTWQYTKTHGGIEKHMSLNPSALLPKPTPTQHLVQVIAVALNPVDHKPVEGIPLPAKDSSIKKGDVVFGIAGSGTPFAGGALSEYAVSGESNCVVVPESVDPVDAATVGVAGLTAYQSITPHVKMGEKVFINGGSGGTGCFGIQIAKAHWCDVATSCSRRNVELCQSLGADEVVDYTKGKIWEQLKETGVIFDHVVDNIGNDPELYFKCHEYTTPRALYVMVGGTPSPGMIFGALDRKYRPGMLGGGRRKYTGFFSHPEANDLRQIGAWIKEGKVKAVIEETFKFEEIPRAFEKLKTGRARGKVVVDVASETYKKSMGG